MPMIPMDMTGYIVNPNFNSNITGWTSTGAQNNTTATNQNVGAFEEPCHSGKTGTVVRLPNYSK